MVILSWLKTGLLRGADGFNAVVGGPQPFTRAAQPDLSAAFPDDMTRRDALAVGAERELESFTRDGVFFAMTPNDLGDAAIWQGVFAAMTALRYRSNPSAANSAAMAAAARALVAYMPNGIVCRGAVPEALEGKFFHRDPTKVYYDENSYVYREDASLDSLLGLMFGASMIQRFGDAGARAALCDPLREPLKVFAAKFKADGYVLKNRDGSATTYGNCAPGFFQAPVRILAAALPSLVAGTDDWRAIAEAYAPELAATDTQVPGNISYVNAHLSMLATATFVAAAPADGPGVVEARAGLRRLAAKYADAGNAFIVYVADLLGVPMTTGQRDKAAKVLIEFPVGAKPQTGLNSSTAPALQPVPVWQRPPVDYIFQRSPYPYSGSDSAAYTRLDYLLAHYLSRSPR